MKVKTNVKGGKMMAQHNETLVRTRVPARRLTVKTGIKAGKLIGPR